ncbi:MAG TPA: DUF4349 domain-containing protein [Solirubrobacterales bacterium]|jgi:hypothetical protein|nr:DUF4349 domain-containing protein [Solirubrobacterales bacterium]
MEPYRDDDLTAALSALRPAPRPAFAAKLDARAAAGFPREAHSGGPSLKGVKARLSKLKPRQVLIPAGGLALTAIVVAAVVISQGSRQETTDSLSFRENAPGATNENFNASGSYTHGATRLEESDNLKPLESPSEGLAGAETEGSLPLERELSMGAASPSSGNAAGSADGAINRNSGYAAGRSHRAVERSAEITLGTDPAGVGEAAAKVFDTVHAYRGVVLSSSIDDGAADSASAEFELLIPSAKLGDAMAAFSGIAEVRSRHEATDDITAPTVGVAEHLEDSKARIDGLLAQLAEADTDSEREAVEAELATERRRAAGLRTSLQNLERRANLSRVALRIESGEAGAAPDAGGSWGIGDALGDAGRILAVGAAVSLVGLAIVGPIALIALLAWLAHRAWLRRARRHALG